jgi:hypothetical protein
MSAIVIGALALGRHASAQAPGEGFIVPSDSELSEDQFIVLPDTDLIGLPREGMPPMLPLQAPTVNWVFPNGAPDLCPRRKAPANDQAAGLIAAYNPLGGTFEWGSDSADGHAAHVRVEPLRHFAHGKFWSSRAGADHTAKVRYTVNGQHTDWKTGSPVKVFDAELTFQGMSDDPQNTAEESPGAFMALGPQRKALNLRFWPGPTEDDVDSYLPGGYPTIPQQCLMTLGRSSDAVKIYSRETDTEPCTNLGWGWEVGQGGEWVYDTPPDTLYVEAAQLGSSDLTLTMTYKQPWAPDYPNASASDKVKVTAVELDSLTFAETPDDRERTTLGMGEPVMCYLAPPINAQWSLVGPGDLEPQGTMAVFTASQSPSQSSVHALVGSVDLVLNFNVIPPNGMTVSLSSNLGLGTPGPPNDSVGAASCFLCVVAPTTVSFCWAQFRENIPETGWTWPDRTPETFGPETNTWDVTESNRTLDVVSSSLHPIGRLWDGFAYVPFTFTVPVPEEYLNEDEQWVQWLSETGPNEYRGTDQKARVGIIATNTAYGSWQGPWQ